jgi:hypothetical protein
MICELRVSIEVLNEMHIRETVMEAHSLMWTADTIPSLTGENLMGLGLYDQMGKFIAIRLFPLGEKTGLEMATRTMKFMKNQFGEYWSEIVKKNYWYN